MPTNASGTLVTKLKSSLDTPAHGWVCLGATVSSSQATTYALTTGEGGVVNGMTTGTTTIEQTAVKMQAPRFPSVPSSKIPLAVTFLSTKVDGGFSYIDILVNGAQLRSTDAALNTKVLAFAAPFLADVDAGLITTLDAGPQESELALAGAVIPGDLLAALKASLADANAGWSVHGYVVYPSTTPPLLPGGLADTWTDVIVALGSMRVAFDPRIASNPSATVPGAVQYCGRLDASGTFVSARVSMNGAQWVTTDAALHDLVTGIADAWQADEGDSLTEALS